MQSRVPGTGAEGAPVLRVLQADSCCDPETGECASTQPGHGALAAAQPRAVRADSCCGGEADESSFDDRVALGQRRRVLVRRVTLAGSALSALTAAVASGADGSSVLAHRFAWLAVVWAAGPVLGWVRAALSARRVDWRLLIVAAGVAAGIVWQPLVPALIAVALLAERAIRPPQAVVSGAPRTAPAVGQPG